MNIIPHSTLDGWQAASENARATQEALMFRPATRQVTVDRYTAVGSTTTRIRIGAGARPWAVQLVRVCESAAEDSAVIVTDSRNFVWDSTTQSLDVFEPDGLTANTVYKLQFLVIEVLS
jgi:hypothetical protein